MRPCSLPCGVPWRVGTESGASPAAEDPATEGEPGDSTDPLSEGAASAAAERAEEETRATAPERRPLSPAEEGDDLLEMFPLGSDAPPLPARLTGRFGAVQLEDPNLSSALSQVAVVDGQSVQGVRPLTHPFFAIKNQLLYQGGD
ncbi:hypothetical protein N1851_033920 [Merluccius polli]|uniref:Uncharacterized protein n=1 Tax=Merluccius polli TaxID=89951 RepID=A0AA47NP25_MERPO|nr:hypothetical protein N1851_033920 [Merluccius polli]